VLQNITDFVFYKFVISVVTTVGLLVLGGWFILQSPQEDSVPIAIKDIEVSVELADTEEKKSQGLSGRNSLPQNQGMLFVHESPALYSFWMKDMQFPIDIIWIDENNTVIDITKNVSPDTFPQSFQPLAPAQYVLEVNAGFADTNNVTIGDAVAGLQPL